jgi:hypothetical protein
MPYDPDEPLNISIEAAQKYRAQGRVSGYVHAAQVLVGDGTFDLGEWKRRRADGTPVLSWSCSAAHGWQIETDGDDPTLADAADPSDFDHVVFTDGWAVVGGSVPSVESFGLPEDLLPAVEQAVETGHKEL